MTVTKEKFYIIKPKAATKPLSNPSFETGTTGLDNREGLTPSHNQPYNKDGACTA